MSRRQPLGLFVLLASCAALGPLQLNTYLPSLPLVQAEFGASVASVQWTVSLAMAAFGAGLLLFGPLSDHFGRRPVLLAGLLAFDAGTLAALFAPNLAVLCAGRMVQSAGASMLFITSRAVVADLTPRENLQRSVAQLTMIMLVGQMVAPILGNVAMAWGGWRTIQRALLVYGLGVTVLVWRSLRETRAPRPGAATQGHWLRELLKPSFRLLAQPRFDARLLQIGCLYAAYPAFIAIAPHLMVGFFGRPPTEYAWYYALLPLGYFAGNAVVLRAGRGRSGSSLIVTGSLVAVGGVAASAALLAAGITIPLSLFLPSGLLLNFGLGLALPSATARAVLQAQPHVASGWSLAGCMQQAFGALGVQVLGFFATQTPWPVLGLCGALALTAGLLERTLRDPPSAAA